MSEKASDIIRRTFDVKEIWVERDGKTVMGKRPEWLDWPMHTGELAPKWEAPKGKRERS